MSEPIIPKIAWDAEKQRLALEAVLLGLLRHSSEMIAAVDPSLRVLVCSPALSRELEQVWGVQVRAGMSLEEGLAQEQARARLRALWERALRGEAFTVEESLGGPRWGKRRVYQVTLGPLYDERGGLIGAFLRASRVTRRRRTSHRLRRFRLWLERRIARHIADLQEQEQRLRAILDSSATYIFVKDLSGRYLLVSSACRRACARSIVGQSDRELFPPAIAQTLIAHDQQVLEAGRALEFEERLGPDGGGTVFLTVKFPLRDRQGRVYAIGGIATDITQRKHIEQALRESQERLMVALLASGTGTYRWDFRTREGEQDPNLDRLLGLPPGQTITRVEQFMRYIHPEDRPQVEAQHQRCLRLGADFDAVYRIVRPDGTVRWLMDKGKLVRDEQGRPLYMAGACVDVTDRQQAQEELRRAREESQRNLAQLQAVIAHMDQGLIIGDAQGNIVHANPAALKCHGFASIEELQRSTPRLRQLFEVRDLQGRLLPYEQWPSTRALRGQEFSDMEVEVRRRDTGRAFFASYGGAPIFEPDGRHILSVLTVRDITARKQSERRLRELNETLEQHVAQRTALAQQRADQIHQLAMELIQAEQRERRRIAAVLHDHLQQLLVAAKLGVESLKPQAAGQAHSKLEEVAELLMQSIEASRTLSVELSPPVLFDHGLVAALRWLAQQFDVRHGLHVEVRAQGQCEPRASEVKAMLFQAVRELLLNVVKHAHTDRAWIDVQRTDDLIQIVVEDHGRGCEEHLLMQIERPQGGFGLFHIQQRLRLLGGSFEAWASPGAGCRITLRAPLS